MSESRLSPSALLPHFAPRAGIWQAMAVLAQLDRCTWLIERDWWATTGP
ncbi:hypothetical protein [Streptomyces chiangmaiensis]|uniref:Uncharacterized protein n=1 Tax=Streptomyces chiangmaiensis TaxID=766497 RepID=A0ABU7FRE7_9ACTN|nr:hypothetical protein [Streptomyces chiangmaiensis]MED7826691.1 hypothetical protein [Streptomyces chiangmaiensis]